MKCTERRCVRQTQQGSSDVLTAESSLWMHLKVKEQHLFLGAKSAEVTCHQYLKPDSTALHHLSEHITVGDEVVDSSVCV